MDYLNQALNAAQSAPVKMRVALEIIGRLASAAQFQDATAVLQQLNSSLPDEQKTMAVTGLLPVPPFPRGAG